MNRGVCKHCMKPIQRRNAEQPWSTRDGVRHCGGDKQKLHVDVLAQPVDSTQMQIEQSRITMQIYPTRLNGEIWFASDPEESELLAIAGVCGCGTSFSGTGLEIEADSVAELTDVFNRVSLEVLAIIARYDQYPDRTPPRAEDEYDMSDEDDAFLHAHNEVP